MKLFKKKIYTAFELAVLKVCAMCAGLIIGAYMSPHVKRYLWVLVVLGVVTCVRAMHYYWFTKDAPDG